MKTRRDFLKQSALAGLAVNWPEQAFGQNNKTSTDRKLHIQPRYHRWHVDEGVQWVETNTGYHYLDWTIPLSQTALVLVDVWQRHYLQDTEDRSEEIIDNALVPLIRECRKKGMEVIHTPSARTAHKHPNWLNLLKDIEPPKTLNSDWPPREFKSLTGEYAAYQRPYEPREKERQNLPALVIHPKVAPMAQEVVIATGDELHAYCKQKGILFLFFAGFNTNACILRNDYATIKMSERGYQVILVRDCTTAMETKETQPTLAQTQAAILHLEMFGQYSITSTEIIQGLI